MPKKLKKKDKSKSPSKNLDDPTETFSKTILVKDQNFENLSSEDDYSCRDISPEHCAELRNRGFTNRKEDLFLEVRSLEERYKYKISVEKELWSDKVSKEREKNSILYKNALLNKEKQLKFEIEELKLEMEKNIHALETQEQMILSQIDMVYKINKDKIINDFFEIIGLNF
ncbi:hypothetical protein NEF87_004137 [Candidatus Lokiarchaeum ossiferum]|uniref:Uncharacterized protein n=1 Tax=Candidatus Lokiarchaeum ossiferum TaxID=2951803 RepID=A0ABY6HWG0_9ARCH|nr:hypothetical protein NEF87_004137 [Candidatus Lokiarchaeum sp. B-35]